MAAYLSTDSPICILTDVVAAHGVEAEGLEVAKECLEEVFQLKEKNINDKPPRGLLLGLFTKQCHPAAIPELSSELPSERATATSGAFASSSNAIGELFQKF